MVPARHHRAIAFYTILLLAASNFAAVDNASNLLQLKTTAIVSINLVFQEEATIISDAVIGAVIKMAAYEAMYGDEGSYRIHIHDMKMMAYLRAGLMQLGLNGFLRRLIIWIDVNASSLLNVPQTFPHDGFTGDVSDVEPNVKDL